MSTNKSLKSYNVKELSDIMLEESIPKPGSGSGKNGNVVKSDLVDQIVKYRALKNVVSESKSDDNLSSVDDRISPLSVDGRRTPSSVELVPEKLEESDEEPEDDLLGELEIYTKRVTKANLPAVAIIQYGEVSIDDNEEYIDWELPHMTRLEWTYLDWQKKEGISTSNGGHGYVGYDSSHLVYTRYETMDEHVFRILTLKNSPALIKIDEPKTPKTPKKPKSPKTKIVIKKWIPKK